MPAQSGGTTTEAAAAAVRENESASEPTLQHDNRIKPVGRCDQSASSMAEALTAASDCAATATRRQQQHAGRHRQLAAKTVCPVGLLLRVRAGAH